MPRWQPGETRFMDLSVCHKEISAFIKTKGCCMLLDDAYVLHWWLIPFAGPHEIYLHCIQGPC